MSRYIDAEALIERWNNMSVRGRTEFDQEIMVAPSIDIVRCKECKRWWGNHYHDNEDGKCPMDAWIDGDGFCSYGERKE